MIRMDRWVDSRVLAGVNYASFACPPDILFLQCINSIDRALLNEDLLEEVSVVPNVRLFFNHKVLTLDFDKRTIAIRDIDSQRDVRTTFDLCIGADGSYSIVRRQLMRVVRCVNLLLAGVRRIG